MIALFGIVVFVSALGGFVVKNKDNDVFNFVWPKTLFEINFGK